MDAREEERMLGVKNWYDEYRHVVHLASPWCGYEYTLCGLAYNEPSSEHGVDSMHRVSNACTCEECIRIMNELIPYLNREKRKVQKANRIYVKGGAE